MNKIILSIILVFGLGVTQILSQEIPIGIRFDVNTSHFILSDRGNSERNQRGFGLSMGGFTRIDFSENFALRPELLLHYKTSKMERFGIDAGFQYVGVEVPIHFIYQTNGRRCFIGTGVYFGYGIDARYRFSNGDNLNLFRRGYDGLSEMNRFDFGIASIVGHQFFGRRLQLVITCKVGLANLLNANKGNRMRLHTLSVGLGYTLNTRQL
jgi:hypothetical protein